MKKVLFAVIVFSIATVALYSTNQTSLLSPMLLANVEALSAGEEGSSGYSYVKYEDVTEEDPDGSTHTTTKLVCTGSGSLKCA